jgi:acyl-homoserine lactone acylase PvdQ
VHGDNAIKYIEAQTYEGAMYGLGMTHARDRLWQMYFFRLIS